MKGTYIFALFLFVGFNAISQVATLKGIVKNEKGDTLTSASVFVKGKKIGTHFIHWFKNVGGYDYLRLFPGAPRNWLTTVAYTF